MQFCWNLECVWYEGIPIFSFFFGLNDLENIFQMNSFFSNFRIMTSLRKVRKRFSKTLFQPHNSTFHPNPSLRYRSQFKPGIQLSILTHNSLLETRPHSRINYRPETRLSILIQDTWPWIRPLLKNRFPSLTWFRCLTSTRNSILDPTLNWIWEQLFEPQLRIQHHDAN